ncbi:DUF6404 family protein [Moritella sp. Urea-trap-13]|uniref:DUF6404 family protein n=1 Tax=Moritella sp. Urea-trap-13 TaxID=2058327 RepID=UPI000C322699|nr:DUF6404 family protein [Moritella sp. Urea-trap-13]PKH06640.1 hypothetical protein CXF93_12120 [Moritella sp. Urea-trap-13]
MSYISKLESAQAELSKTEIWKSNSNPPIFKLLRKLGFSVRPSHYSSFVINFISSSIWFGSVWGLLMWFTIWSEQQISTDQAVANSLIAGFFYGLFMALYYKYSSSKNGLSNWNDL